MIDYKEVVKKDGKKLVFWNMEDFLVDFYNLSCPEELPSKITTSGTQYIVHCPFCAKEGHTKHKLYIKDDLSVGHCFVCTRAFINVTTDIKFKVDAWKPIKSYFLPTWNLVKLSDPTWSLDKLEYECEDYDEKGYQYLVGRNPYLKYLWRVLGFKFLDGNVVMPFFYKGEVFYYQIRFSTKSSNIRYFFPPIEGGHKPPYIIEHGDNKKFIVCEGVYDAASLLIQAPSYTPMAILGSHVTDYQLGFLREYIPKEIVVYMDDTEKSKGVAQKIKSVIDYCPIRIIKSGGEDPEECMIRKMNTEPGSEVGWIDKLFEPKKFKINVPNFFRRK